MLLGKMPRLSGSFGIQVFLALAFLIAGCADGPPTEPAPANAPTNAGKPILGDESRGPGADRPWHAADVNAYDSQVPLEWYDLAYRLVQSERLSPPMASRVFGYVGVTLYEALVPGMRGAASLQGQLNGLHDLPRAGGRAYHWPVVANAALAAALRGMFVGGSEATLAAIDALELETAESFTATLPAGIKKRSVDRGVEIANAILAWAATDGLAELRNCAYTAPLGAGSWEPTPPAFAPALEPCWGELRPFALEKNNSCDPGPPPEFSDVESSQFMAEAQEVFETSRGLTAEQATIARFWADGAGQTGTPPGHSISIASQILAGGGHPLDTAAETYAKVGIAVADGFISCWWSKYEYNLMRPITCIRKTLDANWTPLIPTPPFPEYTSGHSVQSGAAAQVLTDLFGAISFTDHTHDVRGFAPRTFFDFFAAAEEAAVSRLYGGIHFRAAIDRGVEQGRCVGRQVSALRMRTPS